MAKKRKNQKVEKIDEITYIRTPDGFVVLDGADRCVQAMGKGFDPPKPLGEAVEPEVLARWWLSALRSYNRLCRMRSDLLRILECANKAIDQAKDDEQ